MPVRTEDEIMAAYLLRGGKMLERTCRTCGCPLFEVKGKTLCVVCAENEAAETGKDANGTKNPGVPAGKMAGPAPEEPGARIGGNDDLAAELATTLRSLCLRIRDEQDPERVQRLMDAVRAGTEALGVLRRS